MKYDLAVIIPFYNASRFLDNSLTNTIKIKKNLDAQIIYVDDNSKDNGYLRLKKRIRKEDDILLLKSKKNLGPGNARNIGLKKARGRKIIFLDIEDSLIVSKLKKIITISKQKSYNLIHYKHIEFNENNKKIIKKTATHLISSSNKKNLISFLRKTSQKSVIFTAFDKNFISKHKLSFNNGLHEDIFFLYKSFFYNKKKIKFVKDIVYKKNNYKYSIINTFSINHLKGMFLAWKNISLFSKKKLSLKEFYNIRPHIQYRLRGEFVNEFNKITFCSKNKKDKKNFLKFLISNYKKIIDSKFKIKTHKDKLAALLLEKNISLN